MQRPAIRNPWIWLAVGLLIVYIRGLFIDLMDIDASQYASISMEMLQSGHWLQVQHHHTDYLDKPPLLFWSSALSFALFGLHNWSYKLASFLAAAAGVYAVFRFSLLFYSRATARNAAFILASSVGVVLGTNDVRTDMLLMGMVACAMWQFAEYLEPCRSGPPRLRHLLLAGMFVGLAMLAKGPIGLVAPIFAVGTHLILRRDWRRLFQWRWLLGLGVVAIVLLPMAWGLYRQFDLHPEKVINSRSGVSGLYFYFWEQSFGRITGASVWKNNTTLFTFVHVYLWAFLPWPVVFMGALWRRVADLARHRFQLSPGDEGYSWGGFVLTFAALSLSHYKLPHYIFITLPWAAILTARWLSQTDPPVARLARGWWIGQYVVFLVLALVLAWLLRGVFPTTNAALWAVVILVFGALLIWCWRQPFPWRTDVLVQRSVLAAIGTAFVLNFHFYPNLLPFQSTVAVPRFTRTAGIPVSRLAFYHRSGHAMDFYSGRILPVLATAAAVRDTAARCGSYWLFTDAPGRAGLDSAGVSYQETATFQHFEVAQLTMKFLNHITRSSSLEPVYLLKIGGRQHP